MSHESFEQCTCMCHRAGIKMMHIAPCCGTCPVCHDNIKFFYLKEHTAQCRRELEQITLRNVTPRFQAAWCQRTASPNDAPRWSPDNPACGQCAVTALLVQDLFGGELLRAVVEGFGSHYFNRLRSGDIVDLTVGQFPPGTEVPAGEPRERSYVLDSPGAMNAQTRERYELLKERFITCRPKR